MYDSADEPIIFSKPTMDLFLSNKKLYPDLIGLYGFYYYTAKWQKTNQPRCNQSYVMKGLGWTEERVRRAKAVLREMGLIEDIQAKDEDSGKVVGSFIKINFIWTAKKVQESTTPPDCQGGGSTQGVADQGINALRGNKENALRGNKEKNPLPLCDEINDEVTPKSKRTAPIQIDETSTSQDLAKDPLPFFDQFPPEWQVSGRLTIAWRKYVQVRKEKGSPIHKLKTSAKDMIKKLSINPKGMMGAILMIEQSVTFGWTGIFPLKENTQSTPAIKKPHHSRNDNNLPEKDFSKKIMTDADLKQKGELNGPA